MAKQYSTLRFADYDNEKGTVSLNGVTLTAVNFDAQIALLVALQNGIDGITLGLATGYDVGNRDLLFLGPASSVLAQRESKWLVQYHDNVDLTRHTIEIPTADLAQLDPNNRERAFMGDAGVVDAFVTALEAYHRSPGGNVIVVDRITHVGRNV